MSLFTALIKLSKACVLKQTLGSLLFLEKVLESDGVKNTLLGGLQDLAGHEVLVQDEVRLLVVVDDVQLAHAAEVLVQQLHIVVDYLQRQQLVVPLLWSQQNQVIMKCHQTLTLAILLRRQHQHMKKY